jgi:hypothetical protein
MDQSKWIVLALGCLLAATSARADECSGVAGNLAQNCGFETGTFAGWALSGAQSSSAYLGISHGVDNADAHSGNYGAYLGGFGGVLDLSQSLATSAGTEYQIDYWLAQAPATLPPYSSSFEVTFGDDVLFSAGNAPDLPYKHYEFFATALSDSSNLSFGARDDTGFFSLDDVSVTPVATPEPFVLASQRRDAAALTTVSAPPARCRVADY